MDSEGGLRPPEAKVNDNKFTVKSAAAAQAMIILQSVVYGFGDPISKIAFEVTPVYTLMTVRYTMAFAALFLFCHKRIIRTVRTVPLRSWLLPGLCIGASYVLSNIALSMTDATPIAFLRSTAVIITPLFAYLVFRSRYRWQHIVIQILSIPGLYLLCLKGGLSGFGPGEALTVVAAILMAGALVFSGRFLDRVDPVSMTALQAACSAVLAFVCGLFFEGGLHIAGITGLAWLIIVYLAILCTLMGYLLQNLALTRISDRAVALLQTLYPVMTAVFSFLMLGEKLSPAGICGCAIIVACIAAASLVRAEE